jgi:hypothetical protein
VCYITHIDKQGNKAMITQTFNGISISHVAMSNDKKTLLITDGNLYSISSLGWNYGGAMAYVRTFWENKHTALNLQPVPSHLIGSNAMQLKTALVD